MFVRSCPLFVAWTLAALVKSESEVYPHCYDGKCQGGECVIQPGNVPWPCPSKSPCVADGTYCFVDTYSWPVNMIVGCDGKWLGLAVQYQIELDKEWESRVADEKKSGILSPRVEKWLDRER
ncbi:hypothetical protein Slin15195_G048980 [Septoria linicola]|uniref:Granulins domain-containing protein n=1 Tax=Septoria linicola TaxID=215465 RepID=A0A9Q9ANR1_9PEZI|nr:hypothetical protein Slin15195_G048980 [Septoria linicola]